jgi:hypothetical protein
MIVPHTFECLFAVLRKQHGVSISDEETLQQLRIRGDIVDHQDGGTPWRRALSGVISGKSDDFW